MHLAERVLGSLHVRHLTGRDADESDEPRDETQDDAAARQNGEGSDRVAPTHLLTRGLIAGSPTEGLLALLCREPDLIKQCKQA